MHRGFMANGAEQPGAGHGARHPRAVAMLLCERAITDAATGRVSLIGIHGEISSTGFPFPLPECYVYARLTDATGSYTLALDVVSRDDMSTVAAEYLVELNVADPLEDFDIVARLDGIILAEPGYYDLRLWANDRFVHSVSLRAREVRLGEEGAS